MNHVENQRLLENVALAAYYIVVTLVITSIVLILLFIVGKLCVWTIADVPNYSCVLIYIQTVADFWTDVLFCITMYLKNNLVYFYSSVIFTISPITKS